MSSLSDVTPVPTVPVPLQTASSRKGIPVGVHVTRATRQDHPSTAEQSCRLSRRLRGSTFM
jgi:hypothetical protein